MHNATIFHSPYDYNPRRYIFLSVTEAELVEKVSPLRGVESFGIAAHFQLAHGDPGRTPVWHELARLRAVQQGGG